MPAGPQGPEHGAGNEPADPCPNVNRQSGGKVWQSMVHRGQEAPEVYVKLVLTSSKSRVDCKRKLVGLRQTFLPDASDRSGQAASK